MPAAANRACCQVPCPAPVGALIRDQHIRMRSVVRLTASATSALPRWLLLAISIVYASFGLFGRDPWKNEDAAGFGVMWTMANGGAHAWLLPNLLGKYLTEDGPLGYWLAPTALPPPPPWG